MRSLCALIVLSFLFAGCTKNPLPVCPSRGCPVLTEAVIVIPGFKGSLLADESNEVVWITPYEAIFGSRSLALPAPGITSPENLHPIGILRSFRIGGIIGENFYGSFLDELGDRCTGREVVEFAYDWRKSAVETAAQLADTIATLKKRGVTSIDIVAHSFGGLIASRYLRYGASSDRAPVTDDWVDTHGISKVVLAGVPFHGAFQILHDLKFGSTQGLNSAILDQHALSSFPSSFELLPYIDKNSSAPVYSEIFWNRNRLGLFSEVEPNTMTSAFIERALSEAVQFHESLLRDSVDVPRSDAELIVLVGEEEDTPSVIDAAAGRFDKVGLVKGDDTVPASTATVPTAFAKRFRTKTLGSSLKHFQLLDDEKILDEVCGRTR